MATKALRGLPTLLVGLLLISVLFTAYTAQRAYADHEPANKVAAAGSAIDTVGQDGVVLSERLKVSTTHDFMIHLSAECSILTALLTGDEAAGVADESDSAFSFGSVRLRLEIDGQPVPVSTDDYTSTSGDDSADTEPGETPADPPVADDEVGEVTFCNRAYQRTVTDSEDNTPEDGIDTTDDFIRTRTANAFNWVALNVGVDDTEITGGPEDAYDGYDDPANGNNVVDVVVIADYDVSKRCADQSGKADNDSTVISDDCAWAFIGSRTLIVEPTNASIHEMVEPADTNPDDDPNAR